jgi:nuclear-control-of-ATPase protein 2
MTLALAREKLHYSQEQLASLSKQIRLGDLTPILQIYEEDIKSPLRSAVTGTLLRSVFVQIQKAKVSPNYDSSAVQFLTCNLLSQVDINQALAGIDKLLKSQELTFAFVGVAPAFAILYIIGGYFKSLWTGVGGRGQYGGKKKRASVWVAMRWVSCLFIYLMMRY